MKKRFTKIASLAVSFLLVLGIIATPQSAKAATSLRSDSVYEIMVDRFYDGDPTNNATGDAFRSAESTQDDFRYMHGGDWQGVIDKIPYIKGMGYTAVWISPISDPQLWGIPDANGVQWPCAYHGYNVYDPNRANRYFGSADQEKSKEKLKELVDTCHANGLKVIIDVVPNHVGDYLQGTGTAAHYLSSLNGLKAGTQLQPASPFNNVNWYHNLGDIDWSYADSGHNAATTAYLENHDLGGLDDINYDNANAKAAMFGSIKNWFSYLGADAARVDAAKCMRPTDIHELQKQLGLATFGENFDMSDSFIKDWVGDSGETGMLDFPLFQAVVNDFAHGQNFDDTSFGAISVKSEFNNDSLYGSHINDMVTFIDNHDRNRFLTEAGGSVTKLQNALTFLFSARGIPVVFQGTEQNKGNANGQLINGIADTWNRWSMVEKDAQGNVVHDYFNTSTDTYQLIAKLNSIRQKYAALQNGTQREMWSSPHFYAFSRRMDTGASAGQELVCAFNNSTDAQTVTMPVRAESTLQPGTVLVNVMNPSDRIAVSTDKKVTVNLNGNSSKIYAFGDPDKIPVTFHVTNASTNYGQNIYIAGSISELGNWAPALSAGAAACPNYPNWQLTIELPANQSFEYKAIKKDASENVVWQDGGNHTYTVPSFGQGTVSMGW